MFSLMVNNVDFIILFFHPYAFSAYLIAIVALLVSEKNFSFLALISRYMSNLIPLLTISDLLFFGHPILLLTSYNFFFFEYLTTTNKKRKYYIILCLLATILILKMVDYRAGAITVSLFLLGLIVSKIFKFVKSKIFKFGFLMLSFFFVYNLAVHFKETFEYITSSINSKSIDTTDDRSFLFEEIFIDMKGSDYILGRGYQGTYFSQYFKDWEGEGGDHFQRFSIEVGFLQYLLKGGFVLLGITIIVFVKSIYIGFIKYKPDSFKFLIAIWLFIEFTMLSIENVPSFGIKFFFIWILIGILNKQPKKPITIQSKFDLTKKTSSKPRYNA